MSFASTVHLLLSQKLRSAPEVVSDADIEAVETFKRGYIEPVVFDSVVER